MGRAVTSGAAGAETRGDVDDRLVDSRQMCWGKQVLAQMCVVVGVDECRRVDLADDLGRDHRIACARQMYR